MQLNVMFVLKSGKKAVRRIRKIKECRKRSAVNISADSPFPKVKAGASEFPCGVNACFPVREKSRTCTGLPCNEYKTWLEEVLELSGWCTTKESGIYRFFPSPFTILYPSALAGEGQAFTRYSHHPLAYPETDNGYQRASDLPVTGITMPGNISFSIQSFKKIS